MWWTDGSHADDGRVGTTAVFKHGHDWGFRHSYLGTGFIEVLTGKLWAIRFALAVMIGKRNRIRTNVANIGAVSNNSQAAIRQLAHLKPGPEQPVARLIDRRVHDLLARSIAMEIHCVPGHSGIPGNKETDDQANSAQDAN